MNRRIRNVEQAIEIISEEVGKAVETSASDECIECGELVSHYRSKFCEPCAKVFHDTNACYVCEYKTIANGEGSECICEERAE